MDEAGGDECDMPSMSRSNGDFGKSIRDDGKLTLPYDKFFMSIMRLVF